MTNAPPSLATVPTNPDWRSMRHVADLYGLSYETVRKWVREGRLPAVRLGRTVRVDASAIAAVLATEGHIG